MGKPQARRACSHVFARDTTIIPDFVHEGTVLGNIFLLQQVFGLLADVCLQGKCSGVSLPAFLIFLRLHVYIKIQLDC